jgi:hypothetical protein
MPKLSKTRLSAQLNAMREIVEDKIEIDRDLDTVLAMDDAEIRAALDKEGIDVNGLLAPYRKPF